MFDHIWSPLKFGLTYPAQDGSTIIMDRIFGMTVRTEHRSIDAREFIDWIEWDLPVFLEVLAEHLRDGRGIDMSRARKEAAE